MNNDLTSARDAAEARRSDRAWSRLDRQPVGYPAVEPVAEQDTSEMRHFLAAQTSQTV